MSGKDTLVNLGLLAAGGVAIAAASGAYGKGSRSGISVGDMTDEDHLTYAADGVYVHVWFDSGVAYDDYGRKVAKSGEWQVICTTSPDRLNLSPRGRELERQTFRFADPKQRALVAASANDFIRHLLFKHRGKGSAAKAPAMTLDDVRFGDRVTYRDRFGRDHTGRAVMRGEYGGWVLNMGGPHGTPGLVDERNFVRATRGKGSRSTDVDLATLAHFNPEVVTDADLSGDPCVTGSLARQPDSVMRALTADPKLPIPGPSAKKLDDAFNLGAEEAKSLKWFMQSGHARAALDYANTLLGGFGIEYLRSSEDGPTSFTGIDYINLGDTYTLTLLYDRKKRRFIVSTWGDEVERQPRRFAD